MPWGRVRGKPRFDLWNRPMLVGSTSKISGGWVVSGEAGRDGEVGYVSSL